MDLDTAIKYTIDQLCEVADTQDTGGYNIINSIGEVEFKGITYQIQVSLVCDKKIWTEHNQIKFSEIVKVHD
jgi:hypothetical protein